MRCVEEVGDRYLIDDANEDPRDRARKYIDSFEKALQAAIVVEKDTVTKSAAIRRVLDAIQRYLRDARYYLDNERPATALASIAYAEGLLDALNFLGLTENEGT